MQAYLGSAVEYFFMTTQRRKNSRRAPSLHRRSMLRSNDGVLKTCMRVEGVSFTLSHVSQEFDHEMIEERKIENGFPCMPWPAMAGHGRAIFRHEDMTLKVSRWI